MSDQFDIEAVIRLASFLGDTAPPEDYRRVYTVNAAWESDSESQAGIDEIIAAVTARRVNRISGPGTASRHIITPMAVQIDGDEATASSYLQFLRNTDSSPVIASVAVYEDRLRRVDGVWLIQHRVVVSEPARG